jgi:hypothetical protein
MGMRWLMGQQVDAQKSKSKQRRKLAVRRRAKSKHSEAKTTRRKIGRIKYTDETGIR